MQNLWSFCEESASLGLVNTLGAEEFHLSDSGREIIMGVSWQSKNDANSQVTLRRLAHKYTDKIATKHGLLLQHLHCDADRLELTFINENLLVSQNLDD